MAHGVEETHLDSTSAWGGQLATRQNECGDGTPSHYGMVWGGCCTKSLEKNEFSSSSGAFGVTLTVFRPNYRVIRLGFILSTAALICIGIF